MTIFNIILTLLLVVLIIINTIINIAIKIIITTTLTTFARILLNPRRGMLILKLIINITNNMSN